MLSKYRLTLTPFTKSLIGPNIFLSKEEYKTFLRNHKINEQFGFHGYYNNDTIKLNDSFEKYEQLAMNMAEVIENKTVDKEISKLSFIEDDLQKLTNNAYACKLYALSTFLVNSLIHQPYVEKKDIPLQLAVPLKLSSDILQIRPVYSFFSGIHYINKIDPEQPYIYSNVNTKYRFSKSESEDNFLKFFMVVDNLVQPLIDICYELNHIIYKKYNSENKILENVTKEEVATLNENLDQVIAILTELNRFSSSIVHFVTPQGFYHVLRPYLNGYSIYEGGVTLDGDERLTFAGASAGQDPFMFFVKSFFGISAPERLKDYVEDLLDSMRSPHKQFLNEILRISLIKELKNFEGTAEKYSKCLDLLNKFYRMHGKFLKMYIEIPAKKEGINEEDLKGVGDTQIKLIKDLHNEYKIK